MYTQECFGLKDYIQHLNNALCLARLLLESHGMVLFPLVISSYRSFSCLVSLYFGDAPPNVCDEK